MKITCTIDNFKNAVITAERFTGRHITLPILSYILIAARDKKIFINSTNLETGIECAVSGKVIKTGAVAAPAKILSQILQSIQDNTITLFIDGYQLNISTSTSEVVIAGLNPDDFPKLPIIKPEYSFTIPAPEFIAALEQIIPAVATSDLKPELSGIFFHTAPNTLILAGTDSFRLAEKTITNLAGIKDDAAFIVPARTIQEILRIIPQDGELGVSVGEHQVVFQYNETKILSRLIDGTYPPYQNLFPKTYETTLLVRRDDLFQKIRLAAVFSSRLNDVTLKFSENKLEVATANNEAGRTTSQIPVKGRGKANSVVFNHKYLAEGIQASGGEDVVLNLNGAAGPALIQNSADMSFRYLLMPIRSA